MLRHKYFPKFKLNNHLCGTSDRSQVAMIAPLSDMITYNYDLDRCIPCTCS